MALKAELIIDFTRNFYKLKKSIWKIQKNDNNLAPNKLNPISKFLQQAISGVIFYLIIKTDKAFQPTINGLAFVFKPNKSKVLPKNTFITSKRRKIVKGSINIA